MLSNLLKLNTFKQLAKIINHRNIYNVSTLTQTLTTHTHTRMIKNINHQFCTDKQKSSKDFKDSHKDNQQQKQRHSHKRVGLFSGKSNHKIPKVRKIYNPEYQYEHKAKLVSEQDIENEKKLMQAKEQIYNGEGYGYFNWEDQASYNKAIKVQYFLDDLITACRKMKKKYTEYNQDQIKFILYTCVLFPKHETQLISQVLPSLLKIQQQPNFYLKVPSYMCHIKFLCSELLYRNKQKSMITTRQLIDILDNRLHHPYNNKDLLSVCNSINYFSYIYLRDSQIVFDRFKKLLFQEIIDKKYKLSQELVKMASQTLVRLVIVNPKFKQRPFFADFPDIFEQNQQVFQNMLQLLPEIINFNIISFINTQNDLKKLNKKISSCSEFKQPKTKQLLNRYAEYLVILDIEEIITFTHLLQPI